MTWPAARLSELTESAAAGFACGETDPAGVAQIRMNNVGVDGSLNFDKVRYVPRSAASIERFLLKEGDVLFNATNSPELVGKTALTRELPEPFVYSNHFIRVRVDRTKLSPSYLARWLTAQQQSGRFKLMCNKWVNQASVRREDLLSLSVPVPPLAEQCRFATILDKADALRAKRHEAIAMLDQLLQSVFLDMFGDPVTNPKGWPVTAIGDNCEKVTVGIVVKPASYYVESGVPALRSLNIGVNRIIAQDFVYFSEADNGGPLKKTILKAGDVVAVRSGQPGKAAVVPADLEGANAIDVLIARTKRDRMLPEFLARFLNSSAGKALVLAEQRGQVQKHLNVKQLSEAEIPLPPIAMQHQFLQIAGSFEAVLSKMREGFDKTEAVFASIQRRAFTGTF